MMSDWDRLSHLPKVEELTVSALILRNSPSLTLIVVWVVWSILK